MLLACWPAKGTPILMQTARLVLLRLALCPRPSHLGFGPCSHPSAPIHTLHRKQQSTSPRPHTAFVKQWKGQAFQEPGFCSLCNISWSISTNLISPLIPGRFTFCLTLKFGDSFRSSHTNGIFFWCKCGQQGGIKRCFIGTSMCLSPQGC